MLNEMAKKSTCSFLFKEVVLGHNLEGMTLVEDSYHGYLIRIELSGRTFMEVTEKYQGIIDVLKLFYKEHQLQERYAKCDGGDEHHLLVNMFVWK